MRPCDPATPRGRCNHTSLPESVRLRRLILHVSQQSLGKKRMAGVIHPSPLQICSKRAYARLEQISKICISTFPIIVSSSVLQNQPPLIILPSRAWLREGSTLSSKPNSLAISLYLFLIVTSVTPADSPISF